MELKSDMWSWSNDQLLVEARKETPKAEQGEWTLVSPSGEMYFGDSPIQCVIAEGHERIPPIMALSRIILSSRDVEWNDE